MPGQTKTYNQSESFSRRAEKAVSRITYQPGTDVTNLTSYIYSSEIESRCWNE